MGYEAGSTNAIVKATLEGAIQRLEERLTDSYIHPATAGICLDVLIARVKYTDRYYEQTGRSIESHIRGRATHLTDIILHTGFRSWSHFSGDVEYPVPSPTDDDHGAAYRNLHCWEGKYGDLRKDLARHIINHFNETLKKGFNYGT